MEISTDDIKALREETGVSVMDIRKALDEAGGDKEKALALLKERGAKVAAKKSDRAQKAGVVEAYIHADGQSGAIVRVLCETDFVARNEEFKTLAHDIAMQVVAMQPATGEELLNQSFIKDGTLTVKERIEQAVGKLGENITVSDFTRFGM